MVLWERIRLMGDGVGELYFLIMGFINGFVLGIIVRSNKFW